MQSKRGQGLSTNAIILIVLGVLILVVLIVGFAVGWESIAPWLSTDNVDKIATQCDTACSTNSAYDFCAKARELKAEGKTIKTSCAVLSFVSDFEIYGIKDCPTVVANCDMTCGLIRINDKVGSVPEDASQLGENYLETNYDLTNLVKGLTEGQKCIIGK